MYIGDIYLPILSSIDKKSVSKITKEIAGINVTEPKSVSIRRNLQPVTLDGYLYNDGEKNDAQYAEDVEALQYRSAGYCYTQYADLDGFIEIESADAPQTSEELGVRNYSIEGKYLPATKYERVVEVETEMRENEFNIEFPPHVALPIGATNVRVKTSQDSVKLSTPTFMAGNIPIYRPFPAFYPDNVIHSASDTPKYDKTAYKLSYNLLDAKDESISYTMISGVDVPLGSYRVVLRIKTDAVIEDTIRVTISNDNENVINGLYTVKNKLEQTYESKSTDKYNLTIRETITDLKASIESVDNKHYLHIIPMNENNIQPYFLVFNENQPEVVGEWNVVKTEPFNITKKGLTYTITIQKVTEEASNIAVNYGFLLPEKKARVAFDMSTEYNVGECKVYDTVTDGAEETEWTQVFNPEHNFTGDIVVQNSMMRWVIKQTTWKSATKVFNIADESPIEIGSLYNMAFGDESVVIKFKEIKPNYLKFIFVLSSGNKTSGSTKAKEVDTVEITPFNMVIDKDVIGSYKNHYVFEPKSKLLLENDNGTIIAIEPSCVCGLIKSANYTSGIDGKIIETTNAVSQNSYVVPFVIPVKAENTMSSQDMAFVSSIISSHVRKVEIK